MTLTCLVLRRFPWVCFFCGLVNRESQGDVVIKVAVGRIQACSSALGPAARWGQWSVGSNAILFRKGAHWLWRIQSVCTDHLRLFVSLWHSAISAYLSCPRSLEKLLEMHLFFYLLMRKGNNTFSKSINCNVDLCYFSCLIIRCSYW